MNKRILTFNLIIISIILLSLALTSCGTGQLFGPKSTPTPDLTGIQGKVYYADSNEPIADATILLNNSKLSGEKNPDLTTAKTTTDADGNYSFLNIAPGKYVISIELITKIGINSIDFTENVSETLNSFQGVNQESGSTMTMVEPQIDVLAGEVVQEDFIVHR